MGEAGAALYAQMARAGPSAAAVPGGGPGGDVRAVGALAAGARSTGAPRLGGQQQAPPLEPRVSGRPSALAEAQSEWPVLWGKWISKLEARGFLDGLPVGSDARAASLEKAAAKFLQSKAVSTRREGIH